MTEQEVKDKVRAVLRLMKPGYMCAVWSEYSGWVAYHARPAFYEPLSCWSPGTFTGYLADFDLPPFPGDWRDSLVEREE